MDINFAAPADGQPAHVTIRYRLLAAKSGNTSATVEVEVRTELDKPPVVAGSWEAIPTAVPQNSVPNVLKEAICTELVGGYVQPPPQNLGGGDF